MFWPALTRLIRRRCPAYRAWPRTSLRNWVLWSAYNGSLFLCYDEPGSRRKLVGLCIARPLSIKRLSRAARGAVKADIRDTDCDKDGEVVYVDLTISTAGKQAMQAMMLAILGKMGGKQIIAFKRLKTQAKYNIYTLGDFANRLLGT